jgi:hypothetical protein
MGLDPDQTLAESISVADPDSDPYVLGFPDPDRLVTNTEPAPDPSIIKQKQ